MPQKEAEFQELHLQKEFMKETRKININEDNKIFIILIDIIWANKYD
ncbi:hypothetical protein LCGC14_2407660 [marine sediment metagenome]|uniref:Uncharacterized protein n=1 Tax=marine sediment metagenome TaxID=412755 RepID=A0A0F9E5S7_9ZZZZ